MAKKGNDKTARKHMRGASNHDTDFVSNANLTDIKKRGRTKSRPGPRTKGLGRKGASGKLDKYLSLRPHGRGSFADVGGAGPGRPS